MKWLIDSPLFIENHVNAVQIKLSHHKNCYCMFLVKKTVRNICQKRNLKNGDSTFLLYVDIIFPNVCDHSLANKVGAPNE